ncbi:Cna B-type domain-containing protein [Bacillus sp. 166amftsu]|uniref:Cna B-type domain-containing protein n=1 Tax=Bacillus sp. 166amftsu TaxID=1761753 RepID=UPI00089B75DE|nr:Cna B-type domain-containing protein [Bacillus sp. 166amftsu]SDY95363.1 LPXTG-motif cell wall anchor domain-containing protein [Bacillus sp. 166amftsu]
MIKRVTSIFSILMIFMFTIGQSLVPIIASAQELNKTGLVDSFTLDKTELGYGERTGIKVNFSDKSGNQMKTGDTLTLTLPPELQGYSRTIPLKNEAGTDFGTCQITSTNVLCTFSDVVEKLQNIRGFFKFEVQATKDVATGQTLTVDTNLGTNLQTQRITIKGPTEGGGGTAPFSYKAGRMDADAPTEVKWEIPINNNKQQLGADIVLSDTAQSGQTLNLDSFVLGNENLTPQQFMDRGYGTITFNGNSFEIRIYKDYVSGQSFNIRYRTNITESGMKQKTFVNKYTINYQILNEQPVPFSGEAWTDNINSDGGADGDLPPKGTLRIVKHIEGNTEKFIPDVSFKLYTESGQQIGNTYKTDEKGIVEVPDLDPGNYYVQEISAPNYVDFDPQAKVNFTIDRNAEKGVKLMVPNKVKTTSVSGTKIWNDNNNKFGKRPESITVQLLQNGTELKTQEVKADQAGNWNFSFTDLPKYDEQGNEYKYTVGEVKVDGYETKVEGTTITNTYKNTETTEVSGKKVWDDYNNKFGKRPESITVQLLQNGKEFKNQEVKADQAGNWNFNFKDLPKYDEQGNEYKYTVGEVKVDGYETKVEGTTITNTYKNTETTELNGKKVWDDYNNKFGKRPESITVQLLQNGTELKTQEVKADQAGNWNFSFTDLPKYDEQGNEYTYTVSEVKVDGYETKVEGTTITNIYKNTDKTEVSGKKVWDDYNNKFNKRPESITVQLLQNGTELKTQEVKADQAGNWNFDFKDLPKYDKQGNEYKYTVSEVKVKDYETKVEGTTITNTYKNTDKTELNGKKVWDDYNNKFGKRPESITVQLLQNGTELKTQEVKADQAGNWNFDFKDLPKYDKQGNEYKYTVSEVKVKDYETKVEGTTITNTYKNTETTEVSGKKTWKDDNAKDRPEMIKVDLLQNGKVIATQEVSVASEWKYAFKDLAAYDENGVAYKYEVKEQAVDGYKSEVKGNDITNTKVGQTKVEGTKTWNDGNAANRPKTIKVDLLQNGQVIATQEVSEATGWKYTFKELAAYDANGAAYKYEVKEQPVEGYQSEVNGYDITNTKIKDNPSTEPKDPSTEPKNPSTDPNANTDTNSNSKVPPTKENTKTSVWLPKTGGTSMDIISYIGGMLLVALGGFIFARQRMR